MIPCLIMLQTFVWINIVSEGLLNVKSHKLISVEFFHSFHVHRFIPILKRINTQTIQRTHTQDTKGVYEVEIKTKAVDNVYEHNTQPCRIDL